MAMPGSLLGVRVVGVVVDHDTVAPGVSPLVEVRTKIGFCAWKLFLASGVALDYVREDGT